MAAISGTLYPLFSPEVGDRHDPCCPGIFNLPTSGRFGRAFVHDNGSDWQAGIVCVADFHRLAGSEGGRVAGVSVCIHGFNT